MPVYFFAISQIRYINCPHAVFVFIIIHLLVYPASNGYNSYMDRDTSPIGGVKNPMPPSRQLFKATALINSLAVGLSFLISSVFALGIFFYIGASYAYSYRRIRLKKFPVTGYLTVVIFQGAVTFFLVYHGSNGNPGAPVPALAMLASSLLIGGFYPLTQIYQHEEDYKDNVKTISFVLGYKGTFVFTGIVYALAFTTLGWYFYFESELINFIILQIFMLPLMVYFFIWFSKVVRNTCEANFKNTMRMNILASVFTNLGFITLLILKYN